MPREKNIEKLIKIFHMIAIGLEKANDRVLEMLCSEFQKEMNSSRVY